MIRLPRLKGVYIFQGEVAVLRRAALPYKAAINVAPQGDLMHLQALAGLLPGEPLTRGNAAMLLQGAGYRLFYGELELMLYLVSHSIRL